MIGNRQSHLGLGAGQFEFWATGKLRAKRWEYEFGVQVGDDVVHGHDFWYRVDYWDVRINGGEEKQIEAFPADGAAQGPNIAQRAPPIGGGPRRGRNRTPPAPNLSTCLWERELLRGAVHQKDLPT